MSHPKEPFEEAVRKSVGDELNKSSSFEVVGLTTQKPREEIEADIEQGKEEKKHKRKMELLRLIFSELSVYVIGLLLVTAAGTASLVVIIEDRSSQESKALAKTVFPALIGIVTGYVFGKGSSSKS